MGDRTMPRGWLRNGTVLLLAGSLAVFAPAQQTESPPAPEKAASAPAPGKPGKGTKRTGAAQGASTSQEPATPLEWLEKLDALPWLPVFSNALLLATLLLLMWLILRRNASPEASADRDEEKLALQALLEAAFKAQKNTNHLTDQNVGLLVSNERLQNLADALKQQNAELLSAKAQLEEDLRRLSQPPPPPAAQRPMRERMGSVPGGRTGETDKVREAGQAAATDAQPLQFAAATNYTPVAPEPPSPAPVPPASVLEPIRSVPRNPLGDYNLALLMNLTDAEELFVRNHRPQRLTCTNLQERNNPNATLRFEPSGRGNFMAIATREGFLVFPSLNNDPVSARKALEGVFEYPATGGELLRLRVPAQIAPCPEGGYELAQRGVFDRG